MTVKIPSLLKAENRGKLAIYCLKRIKMLQQEVIAEADKKIDDVANFEKNYHTTFASLQSKQNI